MKAIICILAAALVVGPWTPTCLAAPDLPSTTITTTVNPDRVAVGETFTVTCRIEYKGTAEIDGFAFGIRHDPVGLAVIPASFSLGTNSGPDQQFLLKPNQDTKGMVLTNLCDATRPGEIYLTAGDLGHSNPQRGSVAASGFLVSFQMKALVPGSWQLKPTPYIDDSVLYDVFMRPTDKVRFNAPTVYVKHPSAVAVFAIDAHATKATEQKGRFVFARTGPTNSSLVARYTFGGTAESFEDYENVPWWLVIPAGVSEASLAIKPSVDSQNAGDRTLVVTVERSGDYEIGKPNSATMVIHENKNPRPRITILSPTNESVFPLGANIIFKVATWSSNSVVQQVMFYLDGKSELGEALKAPFSFTWSNAPPGLHAVTAKVRDKLGTVAFSTANVVAVLKLGEELEDLRRRRRPVE